MRRKPRLARPTLLALFSSFAAVGLAQEAPKFEFSGYLDIYYQYDFNRPGLGDTVNGRQFDVRNETITLSAVQLSFGRKAVPGAIGGLIQLVAGPNADVLTATDPDGDSLKNVLQAYLSWTDKSGVTVDVGKFLTWIGAETVNAGENDQYSRGFLFTYGQPIYHVGLRGSKLVGPGTLGLYLANGWNEAKDSNAQKSLGLSYAYPLEQGSVALNTYFGNEGPDGGIGFPDGAQRRVSLYDLVATYRVTPSLKVAANVDYASADPVDGSSKAVWDGFALYATYGLNAKTSIALRAEQLNDRDGVRWGESVRLQSLTLGANYALDASTLLRLEFRHDNANRPAFAEESGLAKDRNTITVAANVKF